MPSEGHTAPRNASALQRKRHSNSAIDATAHYALNRFAGATFHVACYSMFTQDVANIFVCYMLNMFPQHNFDTVVKRDILLFIFPYE